MPETEVPERAEQPKPIPRRTVKVSDDVFELVEDNRWRGEDFSNTLRRILFGGGHELHPRDIPDCPPIPIPPTMRIPRSVGQNSAQLEVPLLKALHNIGGSGSREEVEVQLEESGSLTLEDTLLNGDKPIWKTRLQYARRNLVKERCMSARDDGAWMITPKGEARLEMETKFTNPISAPIKYQE